MKEAPLREGYLSGGRGVPLGMVEAHASLRGERQPEYVGSEEGGAVYVLGYPLARAVIVYDYLS
jgi:hypothetical protein